MSTTPATIPTEGLNLTEIDRTTKEREEWTTELRKQFTMEYNAKLEKALQEEKAQLQKKNEETIKAAIEEWRKQQEPPPALDIKALLENQQPGFPISFKTGNREVHYLIREVSSRTERKILKVLRETLLPHAASIASITSGLMTGNVDDKIKDFFDAFEPGLQMLTEISTIILNACPEDEDTAIKLTVNDVEEGLSMFRQVAVLNAFLAVNRIRDFFSLAFRLINNR